LIFRFDGSEQHRSVSHWFRCWRHHWSQREGRDDELHTRRTSQGSLCAYLLQILKFSVYKSTVWYFIFALLKVMANVIFPNHTQPITFNGLYFTSFWMLFVWLLSDLFILFVTWFIFLISNVFCFYYLKCFILLIF